MPHPGYWQQDVHYRIEANIDETTDIIDATEHLTYYNNSPDTLKHVFFHLYQNAFQPDSYYDDLQNNNGTKPKYGKYESLKLGTEIEQLSTEGLILKREIDNTIMKVWLHDPLPPNDTVRFYIKFKTYFDIGSVRRRMKPFSVAGYTHYNGVHWYPRISVYDRKFGWTTDQHLGREFYGDFGTFDVELTFASNYVVEATGSLTNRKEVLPDSLRAKLDIKNFKDKPWNSPPSKPITYDPKKRKTWKYHAENVHDFAFTADPTYRIGETEWNGKKGVAMVQEQHAAGWQNAAEYTAKIIKTFSEDFGMLVYHKMIVADARSGMEYPMITLDGGRDPGFRGLLVHEVGHNWFFGMVGTNETYRAAMDEGFTQFLTAWGLEAIDGKELVRNQTKVKYVRKFQLPVTARETRVNYGYMGDALKGKDAPLNTHSDQFNGALRHGGGYRHVYYKTASMLYGLQYVLGDSLFLDAMKHYFATWKIAHPYFNDFKNSIINYTKVDLNWYFDQWWETTKSIDYGIKGIKKGQLEDQYLITFKRSGRMQMPIDFTVITKEGDSLDFHIPNNWFEKETDATVLPRWIGWDKLKPEYVAEVKIPGKIKNVIIDPSGRLTDVNMLDNQKKGGTELLFDSKVYNRPTWKKYRLNMRPDLWFNAYDGFKLGFHMNGSLMNYRHKIWFTTWYNTRAFQGGYEDLTYREEDKKKHDLLSWNIIYETPIEKFVLDASVKLHFSFLDGLDKNSLAIQLRPKPGHAIDFEFKSLYRWEDRDTIYSLYPKEWNSDMFNNSLNASYKYAKRYSKGNMNLKAGLRSSALLSDYDYHNVNLELKNYTRLGKLELRTRLFGQYGTGSNPAPESDLYFASASPEDLADNKFTRSVGWFPESWGGHGAEVNHFHHGGGLNVRGYSGYFVVQDGEQGGTFATYKGGTGASINVELDFDGLVKFRPKKIRDYFKLDTYLFFDGGTIRYYDPIQDKNVMGDFRMDGGIGTALTIKKWGPLQTTKPTTIRFDMPLLLSHLPAAEVTGPQTGTNDLTFSDYFKFRWVLGISRAF